MTFQDASVQFDFRKDKNEPETLPPVSSYHGSFYSGSKRVRLTRSGSANAGYELDIYPGGRDHSGSIHPNRSGCATCHEHTGANGYTAPKPDPIAAIANRDLHYSPPAKSQRSDRLPHDIIDCLRLL